MLPTLLQAVCSFEQALRDGVQLGCLSQPVFFALTVVTQLAKAIETVFSTECRGVELKHRQGLLECQMKTLVTQIIGADEAILPTAENTDPSTHSKSRADTRNFVLFRQNTEMICAFQEDLHQICA